MPQVRYKADDRLARLYYENSVKGVQYRFRLRCVLIFDAT
jgi:hypothetical protein